MTDLQERGEVSANCVSLRSVPAEKVDRCEGRGEEVRQTDTDVGPPSYVQGIPGDQTGQRGQDESGQAPSCHVLLWILMPRCKNGLPPHWCRDAQPGVDGPPIVHLDSAFV